MLLHIHQFDLVTTFCQHHRLCCTRHEDQFWREGKDSVSLEHLIGTLIYLHEID